MSVSYVNTRIRKSPDGSKWIVEGQNGATYNWDEMLIYDEKHGQAQAKAVSAACKLARDFSRKCRQAVTAYNRQGNAVAVYLKGEPEPHKRN